MKSTAGKAILFLRVKMKLHSCVKQKTYILRAKPATAGGITVTAAMLNTVIKYTLYSVDSF
jgi:hypothetical protein